MGRKNISAQKGERLLFEDIKYFFYITNHTDYRDAKIVALAVKSRLNEPFRLAEGNQVLRVRGVNSHANVREDIQVMAGRTRPGKFFLPTTRGAGPRLVRRLNTFDFPAIDADGSACQPLRRRGHQKGH